MILRTIYSGVYLFRWKQSSSFRRVITRSKYVQIVSTESIYVFVRYVQTRTKPFCGVRVAVLCT